MKQDTAGQWLLSSLGTPSTSLKQMGPLVKWVSFYIRMVNHFRFASEYIGMVLGVLALVKTGVRDVDVTIRALQL